MNKLLFTTQLIEHCLVRFDIAQAVTLGDARCLRGAIAHAMVRPEFHSHVGNKLNYTEPLIRYDTSLGKLQAIGICNGELLLNELLGI